MIFDQGRNNYVGEPSVLPPSARTRRELASRISIARMMLRETLRFFDLQRETILSRAMVVETITAVRLGSDVTPEVGAIFHVAQHCVLFGCAFVPIVTGP
jgi:hypothetical protein